MSLGKLSQDSEQVDKKEKGQAMFFSGNTYIRHTKTPFFYDKICYNVNPPITLRMRDTCRALVSQHPAT